MTTGQVLLLVGMGIFHGINPGMGWLVAVSRGLQECSRAALLWSLPAIVGGHAASVAVVAVAVTVTGSLVASHWFAVAGGAVVTVAGLGVLLSRSHFHWRDVRPSSWQLAGWSFLMSSLHGAGLMLLPVLAGDIAEGATGGGGHGHGHGHGRPQPVPVASEEAVAVPEGGWELADATLLGLAATGVHTVAMLVATGVVALVVYDFFGVNALRLSWVTMDRIWAFSLIGGGLFVLWGAL
ncbi:cell wall anchor protein [Marinactinospora thermotolerans]|uniref:cell wall anchor protein n=1 Tax=Marinactinospora thermotolerans TaxID=531310 RepID=UPI003D920936